jgi:hypothetical protein
VQHDGVTELCLLQAVVPEARASHQGGGADGLLPTPLLGGEGPRAWAPPTPRRGGECRRRRDLVGEHRSGLAPADAPNASDAGAYFADILDF